MVSFQYQRGLPVGKAFFRLAAGYQPTYVFYSEHIADEYACETETDRILCNN